MTHNAKGRNQWGEQVGCDAHMDMLSSCAHEFFKACRKINKLVIVFEAAAVAYGI